MMIKKCLYNVLVLALFTISVLVLNPIRVSAEWKQNDTGWWYIDDSSWLIGWKEIDGKWYYFGQDGYMAHDTSVNGYTLGSDGAWIDTSNEKNNNSNSSLVNINVSLKFNIYIADEVKEKNPNIIKATRQAIFDAACYSAKLNHYDGYSVNNDVLIFDVKEAGTDTWKVDFYEKKSNEKEYDTIGYSVAIVTKEKDGSYKGGMTIHPPTSTTTAETY